MTLLEIHNAKQSEASVSLCPTVYVSDTIYEPCQSNVKLWINIYYCDNIANPSLSMSQNGDECFFY